MTIRRVVTGHTAAGKATVVSDTEVRPITLALKPGTQWWRLWGADEMLTFPDSGSPPTAPAYFPPPGGCRFGLIALAPDSVAPSKDIDMQLALAELEDKLPGLASRLEADSPGMHTSDSIDFLCVLSGEIWLELDDGQEVHLRAGDVVVQNGTRHAWHNKSTESCQLLFCLIGAHRRS